MDELSEILCLMQEAKMPRMPMFLIGRDYWRTFDRAIKKMQELELIGSRDTNIFTVTDDVSEVVKAANKIGHPKVSENFYDGFREAAEMKRQIEEKKKQAI